MTRHDAGCSEWIIHRGRLRRGKDPKADVPAAMGMLHGGRLKIRDGPVFRR